MFCSSCGEQSVSGAKYCHSCGKGLSGPEEKVLTFQDFKSRKEEERRGRFIPKKSLKAKRQKVGSEDDPAPGLVTIQVGMMTFKDDGLKMVRGSSLPLKVSPSTTAEELRQQAVEKHTRFNKQVFGGPRSFALLYPDRSEVVNIPGTNNAFVLRNYKEALGKPYSRINFYICRMSELLDSITSSFIDDSSDQDDPVENEVERANGQGSAVGQGGTRSTTTSSRAQQPCVGAATASGANARNVTEDDGMHYVPDTDRTPKLPCPVCNKTFPADGIEAHVDLCLQSHSPFQNTEREYATLYNSYVDLDNDELVPSSTNCQSDMSAQDVVKILHERVIPDKIARFNICRLTIWDGTMRAMRRKSFGPDCSIMVQFTDMDDNREGAIDQGGPRREFLRLLLQYLRTSKLFTGPSEKGKTLTHDTKAIQGEEYYFAGMSMVLCLAQGGPAPQLISPMLVKYLMGEKLEAEEMLDHIDKEFKDKISEIMTSTDSSELQKALDCHEDLLSISGCYRTVKYDDRFALAHDLCHWLLFGRSMAVESFKRGLESLGFLSLCSSLVAKELLCPQLAPTTVTPDFIRGLFEIRRSEVGSNKYIAEQSAIGYWRDLLEDFAEEDSKVNLADLLIFVTGLALPPPLGFDEPPYIGFLHDKICPKIGEEYHSGFPIANTCANCLLLPLHKSYEDFKKFMEDGILMSPGFGIL